MRDLGRLVKRVMKIVRKYVQHFFPERSMNYVSEAAGLLYMKKTSPTNMGPTATAENAFATSSQRASLFTELAACGNFDWQL